MQPSIPVYTLDLPEYSIASKPDYAALGPRMDRFVIERFAGRRVALRAVFLDDHPDLSRAQLLEKILELGTDRYDPQREGMHHDWYASVGVELHVVTFAVTDRLEALEDDDYKAAPSPMGEFMMDFFESALGEPGRGYSMRMDILLAFDLDQLVAVPPEEPRGYAFKDPDRKTAALLGVVNVLRQGE